MHNSESVLENEMHKLLWDFEIQGLTLIQTDHLISARWPYLVIIKDKTKNKQKLAELWTLLSWLTTVKLKESKKKDNYLDLARELKKLWNMKVSIVPIVIALGTVTGRLGYKRTFRDHPNYNTIEISWNTEKSPGDLRSFKFQWKIIG